MFVTATFTAIPEKTQSAPAMKRVIDYVLQDKKTVFHDERTGVECRLTGGLNCVPEAAYDEFMATKHRYGKAGGVFFKQYVQSFKPDCGASPQQIHEIGMETAKAFEGFEVIVATHIDREHRHNHFIVNSVSCETGKKIQINEKGLEQLRHRSDEICRAYGLETLAPYEKPKQKALSQREYRTALRGDSRKLKLMNAVDYAVWHSRSRKEFIENMRKLGYGVKWIEHYKYITYTAPDGQRFRDNRLPDGKYLKSNMEELFAHGFENAQAGERPERDNGGNERYSDRAVQAESDLSERRAMERAGSAYDDGWHRTCQKYGFDCPAAESGGYGRADDRNGEQAFAADAGDCPGQYGGDEFTSRPEAERDDRFCDEDDEEYELGYDGADEAEGYDAVENPAEMDRGWSDIALGAIALGASIEAMVNGGKEEHERKKKKTQSKKQRKTQRQSMDNEYDLSM